MFEIAWAQHQDRVSPFPMNGTTVHVRMNVTLSGKNTVTAGVVRNFGGFGGTRGEVGTAGSALLAQGVHVREGQLGGGRWRVIDASTIRGEEDFPQSRGTIVIRTSGQACSATVEWRLKPGFTEHKFPMIGGSGYALLRNVSVGAVSCVVRSGT